MSLHSLASLRLQRPTPGRVGRALAVALLVVCVAPLVGSARPARADDVTDLNSRARAVAAQLADLQGRIAHLGEEFNQAQVRSGELDQEMASTRRRLAQARKVESARRAEAARYALVAYVGGGDSTMSLALDGRQWDLTRRNGYASIEIGDRQQLVDDLHAAQNVDADLLASLRAATAEQKSIRADLARQQAEAEQLMAQQQQLQDQVQGKLAQAVARQQAAMAAAAEAKAKAQAEARTTTTTVAPTVTADAPGTAGSTTSSEPNASDPPTTTGHAGSTGQTTSPATTTAPPPVVTPPPVVNPPPPSRGGQVAANAALSQLGVRYSWGGGTASGPSYGFGAGAGVKGFDCSGLTLYAWAQAGVYLYHSAQMQYDQSRRVSLSQLQVGDLVFYGGSSTSIDHVALYIGNGQVVHAPNSRTVVQTGPVSLWNGYFAWSGAGRPG